ncbi:MAG: DUF4349 domain-containing protein [Chloroflexota bacterium]
MRRAVLGSLLALVIALTVGCSAEAPYTATRDSTSGEKAVAPQAPISGRAGDISQSGAAAKTAWDRYVIRTADVSLVVKDVEGAVGQVESVATSAGGLVAQSNVRRDASRVLADVTIQVPAQTFEKVIGELKGLALIVETVRTSSQDVTEEYVDNDAQLANLRAAEDSTRRLLGQTSRMDDVLTVQRELTRIRGDIEKIEGRQRYLQRRTDMSTINVHLAVEAPGAMAAARSGWQPLRTIATAWEASLTFASGTLDVLLAIVVFSWWLVPVVAVCVFLWRRRPRRQPKSKAKLTPGGEGT